MGEGWFSEFVGSGWAPALLAFVFGVAVGWLIWGDRRPRGEGEEAAGASPGAEAPVRPAASSFDALESELRAARALLEEEGAENEALGEEITELHEAVKRANGRLKLLGRAVKRARD